MGLFNRKSRGDRRRGSPLASSHAVPEWAQPFETPEQLEHFLRVVARTMEDLGVQATIDDGWVLLGGESESLDGQRLGLTNLIRRCADLPADEWPNACREHFERALATFDDDQPSPEQLSDWDWAHERVVLRIWRTPDLPDVASEFQRFPVGADLTAVCYLDLDRAYQWVRADLAAEWPIDEDELRAVALANTLARAEIEHSEIPHDDQGRSIRLFMSDAGLAPALLADASFLESQSGALGVLVVSPAQDAVALCALNGPEDLPLSAPLKNMAETGYQSSEHPVSPELYWVHEGIFEPVNIEIGDDRRVAFRPSERLHAALGGS